MYGYLKWTDENGLEHVMRGPLDALQPHAEDMWNAGLEALLYSLTPDNGEEEVTP
jgi:hypothetical protein